MSEKSVENLELNSLPLSKYVTRVLQSYFANLDGTLPLDLYELVLCEVEKPLLQEVLQYVDGNQSKAARALNMNRGTLRRKLQKYDLL